MHDFKKLEVWQKARLLVKEIYLITASFPKEEGYGLISQIRRSAVSIPSNIAEGCGRGTNNQLSHFLDIAAGSAFELETLLIISNDLNYLSEKTSEINIIKIHEVIKMIFGLKKSLLKS